jgi:hypothetical protein
MNTDGHRLTNTGNRKVRRARRFKHKARVGSDCISRAFARERENRRFLRWPMECETVLAHVFRCVCCGRLRSEEERREPQSEVCVSCVRDAGFER